MKDVAPTHLHYRDRAVLLKWHKLRRRAGDAPFLRTNLRRGLAAGAGLEVDLRRLATGEFVCLHDEVLEGETTGTGPVAAASRADIADLRMLGAPSEPVLLLEEVCAIIRAGRADPGALLQLDIKLDPRAIDAAAAQDFAATVGELGGRMIVSGDDFDAVRRLGADADVLYGYDPSAAVDAGAGGILDLVARHAADAHTIYLYRDLVRAAQRGGDPVVRDLQMRGYRVDCWTIDHGDDGAAADLIAALDAGCDQITTNTPAEWAAAELERLAAEGAT